MAVRKSPRRMAKTRRVPLPAAPAPAPDFTIVGVGASAGGFEAFTQLLEGLPAIPNLAIIFVQHLAPHHSSSLASLLSSHTPLPVVEATEGARIVPNRVYVVLPNEDGAGGRPSPPRAAAPGSQPVESHRFLLSVARTLAARACDRSRALGHRFGRRPGYSRNQVDGRDHVRAGPATAKYDGMPRAAIATQMVDVVASPAEIAAKVTLLSKHPYLAPVVQPDHGPAIADEQLHRIFRLLLPACGVNFSHYKTPTIIRRLFRRMALLRIEEVDAYIAHLEQTPLEVVKPSQRHADSRHPVFPRARVVQELISGRFFNDYRRAVGPRLSACGCRMRRPAKSRIRSRSSFTEDWAHASDDGRVQIFGTDVSETAIGVRGQGLYAASRLSADVSPERLRRFFMQRDGNFQVKRPSAPCACSRGRT